MCEIKPLLREAQHSVRKDEDETMKKRYRRGRSVFKLDEANLRQGEGRNNDKTEIQLPTSTIHKTQAG